MSNVTIDSSDYGLSMVEFKELADRAIAAKETAYCQYYPMLRPQSGRRYYPPTPSFHHVDSAPGFFWHG